MSAAVEWNFRMTRQLLLRLEGPTKIPHYLYEPSWGRRLTALARSLINGPIRFLIPAVTPTLQGPTDPIFRKQWFDAAYEPSAEESAILKKYSAITRFQEKRDIMHAAPNWVRFRKLMGVLAVSALSLNAVAAINHAAQLSEGQTLGYEHIHERLPDHQIQLLNETVPFPHLALRIGDQVYSYGLTHMTVHSTFEYFNSKHITQAARQGLINDPEQRNQLQANEPAPPKVGSVKQTLGEIGGFVWRQSGLENAARSVQVATFNLTSEEVRNLKRFLELQTGKRYLNTTFVVDCATMIAQALQRHSQAEFPAVIDPSPSWLFLYASMMKSLDTKNASGQPLVERVFQVALDRADLPLWHLIRNTYINALEGKIFIYMSPVVYPHRAYLELTQGYEHFQNWDPEVVEHISAWNSHFADEFRTREKVRVEFFERRAQSLSTQPLSHEQDAFSRFLDSYIQELARHSIEILQARDANFWLLLRAAHRLLYLEHWRDNLKRLSRGETVQAEFTPTVSMLIERAAF